MLPRLLLYLIITLGLQANEPPPISKGKAGSEAPKSAAAPVAAPLPTPRPAPVPKPTPLGKPPASVQSRTPPRKDNALVKPSPNRLRFSTITHRLSAIGDWLSAINHHLAAFPRPLTTTHHPLSPLRYSPLAIPPRFSDFGDWLASPATSPWSLSSGTAVRTMSADFASHGPGFLPLDIPASYYRGHQSPGTYHGDDTATAYDDGSVGPAVSIVGGGGSVKTGLANSTSQSGATTSDTGRPNGSGGSILEHNFHTNLNTFAYDIAYLDATAASSDDDFGLGTYLQLRYEAITMAHSSLAFNFSYTWLATEFGSGQVDVARESLIRTTTSDTFTASYDDIGGFLLYDLGTATKVIGAPPAGSDFRDPRYLRDRSTSQQTITSYIASSHSDLKVNLHEFLWTAETKIAPAAGLRLGLALGPSLNIIDARLATHGGWRQKGSNSEYVATFHDEQARNYARLGIAAQATAQLALTPRAALQASAGYHYVPAVSTANAFTQSWVDASGWQITLGFSLRF